MGSLQDRFVQLMSDSSLYVNHIYKQCQIMKKYLVCLKITNVYKISLKRDCNVSISHIWQHMLTSSHTESDTNIVISNKEIKIAFDITDVIMLNIKHHANFFHLHTLPQWKTVFWITTWWAYSFPSPQKLSPLLIKIMYFKAR